MHGLISDDHCTAECYVTPTWDGCSDVAMLPASRNMIVIGLTDAGVCDFSRRLCMCNRVYLTALRGRFVSRGRFDFMAGETFMTGRRTFAPRKVLRPERLLHQAATFRRGRVGCMTPAKTAEDVGTEKGREPGTKGRRVLASLTFKCSARERRVLNVTQQQPQWTRKRRQPAYFVSALNSAWEYAW